MRVKAVGLFLVERMATFLNDICRKFEAAGGLAEGAAVLAEGREPCVTRL